VPYLVDAAHNYPIGVVDFVAHVPVVQPTSCAFVGDQLDVLCVTSAADGLHSADRPDGAVLLVGETGPEVSSPICTPGDPAPLPPMSRPHLRNPPDASSLEPIMSLNDLPNVDVQRPIASPTGSSSRSLTIAL
jgi:hypothetical protein